MRVTIEIDEKSGASTAEPSIAAASGNTTAAPPQSHEPTVPADVLALAAATGAINGGPAPSAIAADSAPHPFHSHGGAMSDTAHAAAVSGGAAPQH